MLLNPGFAVSPETPGMARFQIAPGAVEVLELPAMVLNSFDTDLKYSAYRSVGVGAEIYFNHSSLWLVKQIKVS